MHCLRRGTVTLVNALGSQLADDASLLSMAPQIIRYYLHEGPILPTIRTYWLGDLDQLRDGASRTSRPTASGRFRVEFLRRRCRVSPEEIAPRGAQASAAITWRSRMRGGAARTASGSCEQDHIVFALRQGGGSYEVFPGALTRVFSRRSTENPGSWISKDSWVPALSQRGRRRRRRWTRNALGDRITRAREVTSRVAESFYWMGRYLERAYHQAYLIQAIETLESEELNAAERKLYRPMWNRLLPPLETSAGESRRSITTRQDRYRLVLVPEPGTVVRTFTRAMTQCGVDPGIAQPGGAGDAQPDCASCSAARASARICPRRSAARSPAG